MQHSYNVFASNMNQLKLQEDQFSPLHPYTCTLSVNLFCVL